MGRLHVGKRRVLRRTRGPRRERVAQRLRTMRHRLLQMPRIVVPLVLVRTRSTEDHALRILQRIDPVLQLTVLVRELGDVIRLAQALTRLLVQRTETLGDLLAQGPDARRQVLPVLHASERGETAAAVPAECTWHGGEAAACAAGRQATRAAGGRRRQETARHGRLNHSTMASASWVVRVCERIHARIGMRTHSANTRSFAMRSVVSRFAQACLRHHFSSIVYGT